MGARMHMISVGHYKQVENEKVAIFFNSLELFKLLVKTVKILSTQRYGAEAKIFHAIWFPQHTGARAHK